MVDDITPAHHPVSLIRHSLKKAENSVAAAIILIDKEGRLYYDNCGVTKQELLWALKQMEYLLITDIPKT